MIPVFRTTNRPDIHHHNTFFLRPTLLFSRPHLHLDVPGPLEELGGVQVVDAVEAGRGAKQAARHAPRRAGRQHQHDRHKGRYWGRHNLVIASRTRVRAGQSKDCCCVHLGWIGCWVLGVCTVSADWRGEAGDSTVSRHTHGHTRALVLDRCCCCALCVLFAPHPGHHVRRRDVHEAL